MGHLNTDELGSGGAYTQLDAVVDDWTADAIAGGGEWDFLVDGLTTPSGWTFPNIAGAGTTHTAKIQSNGRPFIDRDQTAGAALVQLYKDIVGVVPPANWPAWHAGIDSQLILLAGARPDQMQVHLHDIDSAVPKDQLGFTTRFALGDFGVFRDLNDDNVGTIYGWSGGGGSPGDARHVMQGTFDHRNHTVYDTTGSPNHRTDLKIFYDGLRWFSRIGFLPTDRLRITLTNWQPNVGRWTWEIFEFKSGLWLLE